MQYLWINYLVHEEDDPTEAYVELDENRLERRRIEIYDNGMAFACGGNFGYQEALAKEPYPENLQTMNRLGELEVIPIRAADFDGMWYQLPDRPSGFDGMF